MTTFNSQETLAALVATSEKINGFLLPGKLGQEIENVLALTGADGAVGNRLAANAERELREVLAAFIKGSPRYFHGELAKLAGEVDGDLARTIEAFLDKYALVVASTKPADDFALRTRQYAAAINAFGWARTQQEIRRTAATRRAAAIAAIRKWDFAPAHTAPAQPAPKPVYVTDFGSLLQKAVAA